MTAYGSCQCYSFIIIPLYRAECFHIIAALCYALLTVNHLAPAGRPGGLLEEVIAQKLVALQTLLQHLGLPVGGQFIWSYCTLDMKA